MKKEYTREITDNNRNCDHLFVIKGKRAVCRICGYIITKVSKE